MTREQEKQQTITRKAERTAKPSNYFAALAQSEAMQNESNRAYGFKVRAKAGR